MIKSISSMIIAFLVFLLAASAVSIGDTVINTTGLAVWTVPVAGKSVTLYGTAKDIIDQLDVNHPDWKNFNVSIPTDALVKKKYCDDFGCEESGAMCCPVAGQPWQYCSYPDSVSALAHVKSLNPETWVSVPGGSDCVNIGCVNGCGWGLCAPPYQVPFWAGAAAKDIVKYAEDALNDCSPELAPKSDWLMCGQKFSSEAWNVVGSDC